MVQILNQGVFFIGVISPLIKIDYMQKLKRFKQRRDETKQNNPFQINKYSKR